MLPIMLWWEQTKKRRRSLVFALRAGKLCNRRYMAGNFVTGAKSGKACQQQGRENIRALRAGKCVIGFALALGAESMARRAQDQVAM